MSEFLFIYGTLDPKTAPREIRDTVRRLKFVGEGFVHGTLYDLGDYPGVKLDSGAAKVQGRVYRLPTTKDAIRSIDRYEEFYPSRPDSSLYLRKLTDVELGNGQKIRSWIYEYNGKIPRMRNGKTKVAA